MTRVRRSVVAAAAVLVVAAFGTPAAQAGTQVVTDHEAHLAPSDVEIGSVSFSYTKTRVSARVSFDILPSYVDRYSLSVMGPGRNLWTADWSHGDRPQDARPWRVKGFRHWVLPAYEDPGTAQRCKVAWHEDLDRRLVTVSFPSSCVQVKGKPVAWLRMNVEVIDVWEDSYIADTAPGGNSYNERPHRLTGRIPRG